MLMKTVPVGKWPDNREVTADINFNGDYFLDGGNNVFLQRHPTTLKWFLMVRDGYWNQADVEERNARISNADRCDFCFDAAWSEYLELVTKISARFYGTV